MLNPWHAQKKLLVVDDIDINREIIKDLFKDEFEVLEARDGMEALRMLEQHSEELSIVLLDLVMPHIDGVGVLRKMNEDGLITRLPVVLITGENDDEKALICFGLGVSDLIVKPFNPDIVYRRVRNVIDLYSHKQYLEHRLAEQKEMLETQARRIAESNQYVIDALSTTVEFRNFESGEHIKRIRVITGILLEAMREVYPLSQKQIELISNASAVHDIGKIAISDTILLKPGPLTEEEFEVMKMHTVRGCEILETLDYMQDREFYRYCYEICRHHHERFDGGGYPDGLKGDAIPIWAQATSLADVYDALTSKRVYKERYTHDRAVQMILCGECGVFNPVLLEHFCAIEKELPQRIEEHERRAGSFGGNE